MSLVIDEKITRCILKAEQFQGVSRVGIFGSFARAEQTGESDIDILYDYYYENNDNNGIDSTFIFLDLLENELSELTGNKKIDFTSYHGLMDSQNEVLKQGILNDVVWIYDRNRKSA